MSELNESLGETGDFEVVEAPDLRLLGV